jgi:hypothetical protein
MATNQDMLKTVNEALKLLRVERRELDAEIARIDCVVYPSAFEFAKARLMAYVMLSVRLEANMDFVLTTLKQSLEDRIRRTQDF